MTIYIPPIEEVWGLPYESLQVTQKDVDTVLSFLIRAQVNSIDIPIFVVDNHKAVFIAFNAAGYTVEYTIDERNGESLRFIR